MAALLAVAAGSGCSRHDPIDASDDTDGGASGRSSAGRGGRGGGGGTSGTMAGYVKCGSKQCAPPANLLAALPFPTGIPLPVACCADAATSQCGSQPSADAMCEPPAVPDPRCPGVDLGRLAALAGGGTASMDAMNGCCAPDDKCGLDGTLFGRGCVENAETATLLSSIPLVGDLITVPAPRACDAPPDEAEADGGAEDAG